MRSVSRQSVLNAETYAELRDELAAFDCRHCGLSVGRTNIVVDRGHPHARLMLVGEAPGVEEDKQGKAFVGRSGRLLDAMLLEAGIDPAREVLIANIAKCRPPENRRPSTTEAQACLPYLRRQIELVKPDVVGLLGATAVEHLLAAGKKAKISKLVGQFVEEPSWPGVPILVLFHPAYILRNPSKRALMVQHLLLLRERQNSPATNPA